MERQRLCCGIFKDILPYGIQKLIGGCLSTLDVDYGVGLEHILTLSINRLRSTICELLKRYNDHALFVQHKLLLHNLFVLIRKLLYTLGRE